MKMDLNFIAVVRNEGSGHGHILLFDDQSVDVARRVVGSMLEDTSIGFGPSEARSFHRQIDRIEKEINYQFPE